MDYIEILGWTASGLTIASYAMKTMLPLRLFAILSSLAFGAYGLSLQLWPLVVMEATLLPFNLWRFWELFRLRSKVAQAGEDANTDFDVVRSYGRARKVAKGERIFSKGDPVDQLYFLDQGVILITEAQVELKPGAIFGEIGFFTEAQARTATAECTQDAVLYELNRAGFMRLQFEDPGFGLAVMKTITQRLQQRLEPLQ